MTDIFQVISNKLRTSKFSIIIFGFAVAMFIIGLNHFNEDYLAGKHGLHTLESVYDLRLVVNDISYTTMALSPQVAQIVLAYAFLLDVRKNKWYGAIALAFFLMDFIPDLWYRSNGDPTDNFAKFVISSFFTITFFTIGSELFITVGGGVLLELFKPTLNQFFDLIGVDFRFKVSQSNTSGTFKSKKLSYSERSSPFSNSKNVPERSSSNMKPLPHQNEVFSFIRTYKDKNGGMPSYKKIVQNTKLSSTSVVKGYMERYSLMFP